MNDFDFNMWCETGSKKKKKTIPDSNKKKTSLYDVKCMGKNNNFYVYHSFDQILTFF